jgi:ABC-type nitrate/sulfonate/bicarbonate transport system substrate-binding protein
MPLNLNRGQAVGAILALAAGTLPNRSVAQALQRLKAAATPIEADSLIWLAQSQGYLQRAGLALDIQSLGTGDAIAAAMVGGEVDIGSMNIVSLALAHQNGVDLKIIAGGSQWESGHGGSQLMVRQDSPINGGAALSGKTVGINVLRGLSQMVTSAWIDKHGGDSTKVQFVEMPFGAMQPALDSGRVAAAQISQPWATSALSTCRSLGPPNDAIANRFLLSAYVATGSWAAAHKDVIRRFQSALSSCAHWIDTQPNASIGPIADLTKQDPTVVAHSVRSIFSEGLTPAVVQPILDAAAKYGVLKAPISASDIMA